MTYKIAMGSRVRKSPFFDATIKHGVTHFTVYNHMFMPTSYGDPDIEYKALTERVSLWDVACQRQIEVIGPDAAKLLNYLISRSVDSYPVGKARYTPICDHKGILLNDPITLRLDDDRFWISIADGDLEWWIRASAVERGLDCEVFEPDVSPLAVQGPRAEDTVANLFGDWIREIGFFCFTQTELDGIPVVICRSGWSGQGGFELFLIGNSRAVEFWERVWEAGVPYGIHPGAPNPSERIESSLLSYRGDCAGLATPLELGLGRFLELDRREEFVGKAALLAEREHGSVRKLVKVTLSGERLTNPSEEPWMALGPSGKTVGQVRVAVWSPVLNKNLALALVDIETAGKAFDVVTPEGVEFAAEHFSFFGD
tara:strand:- start:153 stop:1262 length:1110 start_codon:yes stop_codon:yes gene_type:complete